MLEDNQNEQQALVEKATRRGGRGRGRRKKTISDMSGMLTSMGQDDLTQIAVAAASPTGSAGSQSAEFTSRDAMGNSSHSTSLRTVQKPEEMSTVPENDLVHPPMREPTVPGNSRTTADPFGASGQYGQLKRASYNF